MKSKVLLVDIETSPNIGYFWRPGYNISLTPDNIIEERQVICISYKWLGEKKVHNLKWDPKKKDKKDKALLAAYSKIHNEAEMFVAHNGDAFDLKWINGRLLYHGMDPLNKVRQYDTLKIARSMFNLNSNKLDYIAQFLGMGGKNPMGFGDWKAVMCGDAAALKKMCKYCDTDVKLLEKVYLRLDRYVPTKANKWVMERFDGRCGLCAGPLKKDGKLLTAAGEYQRYRCKTPQCKKPWVDTRKVKEDG